MFEHVTTESIEQAIQKAKIDFEGILTVYSMMYDPWQISIQAMHAISIDELTKRAQQTISDREEELKQLKVFKEELEKTQ